VWGEDRDQARGRMVRAIDELIVEGVPTTAAFGRLAMLNEQFAAGEHCTASVEREWDISSLVPHGPAASGDEPDGPSRDVVVEVGGRRLEVKVYGELATGGGGGSAAPAGGGAKKRTRKASSSGAAASAEAVVAPMQGTVVKYAVEEGATVVTGELVCVLEAMKMENTINAHRDGTVTSITYAAGDVVEAGTVLANIE
jgi:acetyl-CoA/propionyl-CoA carboxylase biotin carboxyl carrier protein